MPPSRAFTPSGNLWQAVIGPLVRPVSSWHPPCASSQGHRLVNDGCGISQNLGSSFDTHSRDLCHTGNAGCRVRLPGTGCNLAPLPEGQKRGRRHGRASWQERSWAAFPGRPATLSPTALGAWPGVGVANAETDFLKRCFQTHFSPVGRFAHVSPKPVQREEVNGRKARAWLVRGPFPLSYLVTG